MAFEDVIGRVATWGEHAQALAAIGAELALLEGGPAPTPEIRAALRGVANEAGVAGLEELPAPQRGVALALIRMFLHQAVDLVADPARGPGWGFTDPAILDGWGRASMMVPPVLAQAHPDLAEVGRFLDVGTGVGLLAVAATEVWPSATVVGIDTAAASLARAEDHVAAAGRGDRVELRNQDLAELDDVDAFDAAWVPSFFMSGAALQRGLPAVVRALRPGGWVVLGCNLPADAPLAAALATLEAVRNGASELTAAEGVELLEAAGCADVHSASAGPAPIALVLGRRPG